MNIKPITENGTKFVNKLTKAKENNIPSFVRPSTIFPTKAYQIEQPKDANITSYFSPYTSTGTVTQKPISTPPILNYYF